MPEALAAMPAPTILIVPGLRDAVPEHWQTLLHDELRAAGRAVHSVPPMGRSGLDLAQRVAAIERAAQAIHAPLVIVAHSGGCITVAHWAQRTNCTVQGALLAVPPDFEHVMPAGYPTLAELKAAGWLPVPRKRLPFPSVVAASRNDPLGPWVRVVGLAWGWGSELVDLGEVGHLNPASGFGRWPQALPLIEQLAALPHATA
jgi:predicted alpha/beta hydrolase family esterase